VIDSFFWRKFLARTGLTSFFPSSCTEIEGAEVYLRYYSDRTLATPVNELIDPCLLPEANTPDVINLALGAPRCETPICRGASDVRPSAAWGNLTLRTQLTEKHHRDHGVEHDPNDEVLITHGASGAFASMLDGFVNPGDSAVLFDPTSPIFPIGLKHRRARLRWLPTWSDGGRVRFAMDAFTKCMRGAKLLVIADPVNPTGCVFAPEDLEQIAFWARKHDVLIFQDASFDRWRDEPARARLASLPHAQGRIITCGSFAKSHGLSSVRVGWLTGHRHLVRPCAAAMMMTAPFVPAACQRIALEAIQSREATMNALRDDIIGRRDYVRESLQEIGLEPWDAAGGFFFWAKTPGEEAGRDFAQRLLRDTGVLINPGSPFSPSGYAFVRISYVTDEGRLREGLDRLRRFVTREPSPGMPVAQLIP
jgi:aspartate/methionine/tyrosine aminotransferase